MKHFLLGVAVGAIAMGYHTGYIRVLLGEKDAKDVAKDVAVDAKNAAKDVANDISQEMS